MCFYDYLKDIIIPLLSALIGGLVTMLGVIITIKWEVKKEKKDKIDAIKPWLYCLNHEEQKLYSGSNGINLLSENERSNSRATLYIKNAGNGIGIVKLLKTECVEYYPSNGNILDKNSVTLLNIHLKNRKETLKNMRLYISDIYDHQYEYMVFQDEHGTLCIKEKHNKD